VDELFKQPAHQLAAQIRAGEVSAVDVLEAHLARIRQVNSKINAIVTLSEDEARQAAEAIDQRRLDGDELGPLAGVPVGIKDITETAGIRTTYGCPLYTNNVPDEDALIVARLKAAGAVIIGKTNTPEFAAGAHTFNEIFGVTRNPWDTDLSASGSTGGGAAGLAAGLFAIAEGSDLGGSLRTPAAFCGIAGIRPTPGLVPKMPVESPFELLDVTGPMARTAKDLAFAVQIFSGRHDGYPLTVRTGHKSDLADFGEHVPAQRLAYVNDVSGVGIEPEIAEICEAAAGRLADHGHKVEVLELDLSMGREAFTTLRGQWMVNRHLDKLDKLDKLGGNLRGNIEKGLTQTPLDLAEAEKARKIVWQRMNDTLADFDAVLTPTTPVLPFPVEQSFPATINGQKMASYIDWIAPTFVISLLGLPAASIPAGLSQSGLPVGLQLIGRRFDEMNLLALAHQVEMENGVGLAEL